MNASTWRSGEIALPDGIIAIEVSGSGRLTRQTVLFEKQGVSREVRSLGELADIFASSRVNVEELATSDPVGLAYLVCLLSDRAHHIFPRETMWPELEQHFSLLRSENEPRVSGGKFEFVAYSQYMPILKVSRLTVDLVTLEVREEPLINAEWPPVAALV